ncbi:alpha/beta hydrolase [Pseudorhodoferax sp. Leaf267]|uniref:RBBP9/YdeN family alpha/beta hydrolase n=1 Tax=Pseudorhodoferax sp. Leaf267 TaxID=1736316 RepID=UPI0006F9D9A9|nr:alpha/beta hydrolase [Pseudorhodoferax sp. Leaf267]KQP22746.1 alpha/beta hydrolase [Pseudorhodoferax sp. Leaf267]
MRTLIIPGWRNSGPGHWQTLWEQQLPDASRVQQDDWATPTRRAWVGAVSQAVLARPDPVLLVAHSLGCIVVSHLPAAVQARVQGALLVAPADPERRAVLQDFAPVPYQRLPFASIVVASTNDPYCPARLAGAYARSWGSALVKLPDAGHINVASGFGHWPEGLELLRSLATAPRAAIAAGQAQAA